MANELQNTLNDILEDKNTNLKPENLKQGVTCLGVEGAIRNVGDVTITPTTSEQTKEQGYYNSLKVSAVTSAIDSNITPENIKKDISILGVTGTLDGGIDTSDADATPDDIITGKTAYVKGEKITGNIIKHSAFGATGQIQNGYNDSILIANSNQLTKPVYISNSFSIELNVSQIAEFVDLTTDKLVEGNSVLGIDGTAIALKGQTKTVTPTTNLQTIIPDENYNGLTSVEVSAVTSAIDENIKAENIKSGVEILGVTGTLEGGTDTSDATATVKDILAGKTAYVNGEKLEGTMVDNGDLIITPNTDEQDHSAGYYNSIQVRPVTSSVDTNIKAENIKSGISILGVNGTLIELNGHELEVTPATVQKVIEPEENYNAITRVTVEAVTSAIDSNITPENIKSGVSILGVVGTYTGEVLLSNQVPTSSPDKLTYAVVVEDGGNYLGTYKYDPSSESGGTWEKLVETV